MVKYFFILVCLLFTSCSKSIYYAWEGKEWGYCTLEVKKHQVIYRATAPLLLQSTHPLSYVYLYSDDVDKYLNNLKENVFRIDINNFEARYCVLENINTHDFPPPFKMNGFSSSVNLFDNSDRSVAYVKKEDNKNIIALAMGGAIKSGNKYDWLNDPNVVEPALLTKGIVWFPPEMHRVDKIDYKKFGERLQHINLKDPWKGTKNGNPKNLWFPSAIW